MARDITTAFNNAIKSTVVQPLFAIELEFSDGTLRFWNGYGNLTMTAGGSSKTFTGAGGQSFMGAGTIGPVGRHSPLLSLTLGALSFMFAPN